MRVSLTGACLMCVQIKVILWALHVLSGRWGDSLRQGEYLQTIKRKKDVPKTPSKLTIIDPESVIASSSAQDTQAHIQSHATVQEPQKFLVEQAASKDDLVHSFTSDNQQIIGSISMAIFESGVKPQLSDILSIFRIALKDNGLEVTIHVDADQTHMKKPASSISQSDQSTQTDFDDDLNQVLNQEIQKCKTFQTSLKKGIDETLYIKKKLLLGRQVWIGSLIDILYHPAPAVRREFENYINMKLDDFQKKDTETINRMFKEQVEHVIRNILNVANCGRWADYVVSDFDFEESDLLPQSSWPETDLHGTHINSAVDLFSSELYHHLIMSRQNQMSMWWHVICGQGKHSASGAGKMKNTLIQILDETKRRHKDIHYKIAYDNPGMIKIKFLVC